MTSHDINAIARFRLRPAQCRHDVDDLDRLRIAFAGRLSEIVHRYFETAAVLFAVTLELRLNPAARRADAAGIALHVGKGMPRPKADELPNGRLDILRGDLGEDRGDLRVLFYLRFRFGRHRRDSESPRRKSEKDDDILKHSNSAD